jgi:hypothetical protein
MIPVLASLAVASCVGPFANDFAVGAGTGHQVNVAGVGWETPVQERCLGSERLHAGFLARLDGWHGKHEGGRNLLDASLTPFLRYDLATLFDGPLFLEGGIGFHLLSGTQIDDQRALSTAFQFGEFAGLGVQYGDRRQYTLSVRVHHVSTGGIKRPNDGLTYTMLSFGFRF